MHHDTPLITTIVAGLVLAYIFGMIANRLRMPPLVGYLFAGILVGPNTPGFVADQALGAELAELGVILLMFGVGLHFSLKDLMSVRALAIPGALAQIGLATLLGLGLGLFMGWGVGAGLLFGLALSVASTVVLLKALQDRRLIETERGRIAVGWLIVEDLAMVLALVLIPAIASINGTDTGIHDPFVSFVERIIGGSVGIWGVLALTLIKIAAFVGFMLVVGRRVIPWALHGTAHTGSRELFRLAVLAIALGVALGSAVLFGVSLALGAFFAGMILSESELSHRAAQETLPLRDAFSVLFFVSVGMLFDPTIILTDPLPVIATVLIIIVGKSLAAFGIVLLFRRPVSTALTISASLAQIGEFSFILASMGVALAILPPEGQDLILAGALISIVLNPVVFWLLDVLRPQFEARIAPRKAEPEAARVEPVDTSLAASGPLTTDAPSTAAIDTGAPGADDDTSEKSRQTDHIVMVGYGQVGRIVADGLKRSETPLVVIEDSDHDVAAARKAGFEVVFGNAASADVLRLANLPQAKTLLVAIANGFEAGTVCESGRKLNSSVRIMARAYSAEEEAHLRGLGADIVIRGEREIGLGLLAWLRGERSDEAGPAPVPEEPVAETKFAPTENLLARAASQPNKPTTTAIAIGAVVSAGADAVAGPDLADTAPDEAQPAQSEPAAAIDDPVPEVPPATPDTTEAVANESFAETEPEGATVDANEPPETAQDTDASADDASADPVVIEAVEAGSTDPDPDIAEAAALESVAVTPPVAETPTEVPDASTEPSAESAAEPTEPDPVSAVEAPAAPAPTPEPDPEPAPTPETPVTPPDSPPAGEPPADGQTPPDDEKPRDAGSVPPVVPEPKR